MAEKRQRGLREMWSMTVTNKKKKKDAAGNNVVKAYPNIVVNKVRKASKFISIFDISNLLVLRLKMRENASPRV